MVSKTNTVVIAGTDIRPVAVEVDISPGLFDLNIVGMASKEIIESKKRIYSAITNSGFKMPSGRIIVNLAPADIPKTSTGFDLPIAVGILTASKQIEIKTDDKVFWGELSLNGELLYSKGVMAIALEKTALKNKMLVIPLLNADEALICKCWKVMTLKSLGDINAPFEVKTAGIKTYKDPERDNYLNNKILNNFKFVRAILISSVGRHNLLTIGPAGVGKTYMLRAVEHIQDQLKEEDFYEVNKIYSIAGLIQDNMQFYPPFRSLHHTITQTALIGGGSRFRVGEISLAHKGFLFLDELNLFSSNNIDLLRQPLEDGYIFIQRGGYNYKLPCDFTLLATMNPCPCGHFGSTIEECKCTSYDKSRYWSKINKPMLDRIDLQMFVGNQKLFSKEEISLGELKAKLMLAKQFRKERDRYPFSHKASNIIDRATTSFRISLRGRKKLISVAKTIADLDNSYTVDENHVSEALSFRTNII